MFPRQPHRDKQIVDLVVDQTEECLVGPLGRVLLPDAAEFPELILRVVSDLFNSFVCHSIPLAQAHIILCCREW